MAWTVAVVNNGRVVRECLCRALEREGFRVRPFASAVDALELVDDPVDIALLDYTNPPLGGIALFRRLRQQHRMPVMFVSAWADEVCEMLAAERMPAEGYMNLPVSMERVVDQVTAILAHDAIP